MKSYVPTEEKLDAAMLALEATMESLKKAKAALTGKGATKNRRTAQTAAKNALKSLQLGTVALFGQESFGPLEDVEIAELAEDGRVQLIVGIGFNELACISEDGSLDGLNNFVDDEVGGVFSDLNYRAIAVDHENDRVLFEVDADCSDMLHELPLNEGDEEHGDEQFG